MRHRSQINSTSDSVPSSREIFNMTTQNGILGQQAVLPVFSVGTVPTGLVTVAKTEVSIMEDDLLYKKGIAPCDHVVRFSDKIPLIKRVDAQYYWTPRLGYGSSRAALVPSQVWFDNSIGVAARSFWNAQAPLDVVNMTDGTALPTARTDDRLAQLAPKIIDRMSSLHLANTAWEARELPALFKFWNPRRIIQDNLPKLRSLRLGLPGSKFQTMKQLAREYRNGQLSWSFGIMPTIQDLTNINRELRNFRPMKKTYVVTIRDNTDGTPFSSVNSATRTSCSVSRRQVRVHGCRVTANGNDLKTAFFQKLESYERRLVGVNPLGVIWEAVPFSFAVDWLLSIDAMLDQFYLNTQNRYDLAYWSSNKISAERQITYDTLTSFNEGYTFPYPGSPVIVNRKYETSALSDRYSHYIRVPRDNPNPIQALRTRPSLQKVYLLALIALGIRR